MNIRGKLNKHPTQTKNHAYIHTLYERSARIKSHHIIEQKTTLHESEVSHRRRMKLLLIEQNFSFFLFRRNASKFVQK